MRKSEMYEDAGIKNIYATNECFTKKTLLLIDDDHTLRERLAKALNKRGFHVLGACTLHEARHLLLTLKPHYAIVDLKLEDGYGLDIVRDIRAANDGVRIIILTGYGNIATAVSAMKQGAIDYLSKPADADAITKALLNTALDLPPPPLLPMSPDRVRWEHIQRILAECQNNISETARRLKMHRRTLQRIISKHAPRS